MQDCKGCTDDGLDIVYDFARGMVTSLKLDQNELAQEEVPSGFLVRDVAAGSDFVGFSEGHCAELGLDLDAHVESSANCVKISGQVTDTRREDRAITLMFALPVDALGWKWHDDVRCSRTIEGGSEYTNAIDIHTGANGMLSLYPFGSISGGKYGLALAMDMDVAAQYRIGYDASAKHFFISYDFGLVKETDRFPSAAQFRCTLYRPAPYWGFRSAKKKFY